MKLGLQTVPSNLVGMSSSIGLDAIGAPTVIKSILPTMLGALAYGSNSVGGGNGGPTPTGSSLEDWGKRLVSSIAEGAKKFVTAAKSIGTSIVNFGQKLAQNIASGVQNAFGKVMDSFYGLFDRNTVESMNVNNQGIQDGFNASVTIGDITKGSFTGKDGKLVDYEYNASTGVLTLKHGDKVTTITKPVLTGDGRYGFEQMKQSEKIEGTDNRLNHQYIDGKLVGIELSNDVTGKPIYKIEGLSGREVRLDSSGNFYDVSIQSDLNETTIAGGKVINQTTKEFGWAKTFKNVDGGDEIEIYIRSGEINQLAGDHYEKKPVFSPEIADLVRESLDKGAAYYDFGNGLISISSRSDVDKQIIQKIQQKMDKFFIDPKEYLAQDLRPNVQIYPEGVANIDQRLQWMSIANGQNKGAGIADALLYAGAFLSGGWMGLPVGAYELATGGYNVPSNWRWKESTELASTEAARVFNSGLTDFGVLSGVNAFGLSRDELNAYRALIGAQDKKVVLSHSAGTDELQKTLSKLDPLIKSELKFIFGSPRMDPKTFNDIITANGLRKDQVLIIQSSGDLPHTPYLGYANLYKETLENLGPEAVLNPVFEVGQTLYQQGSQKGFCNYDGNWSCLYAEVDETFQGDKANNKNIVDHGTTFDGVLSGHLYNGEFEGQSFDDSKLSDLIKRFLQRSRQ